MDITDGDKRAVIHASVPAELARGLKALAAAEDRSVSAELRRAVAEHIAAHEREDGA